MSDRVDAMHPLPRRAFLAVLGALPLLGMAPDAPLTVFAASSLAGVTEELLDALKAENGVRARVSYASSSTLARQIASGAPADVFLSADEEWMAWLRSRVQTGAPVAFAGNALVVAVPEGRALPALAPLDLLEAMKDGRIATGDPEHVPLGRYALAVLEREGRLRSLAPQILPFESAASATRAVETGSVAGGILYATDAAAAAVQVMGRLPDPDPPIRYFAAALDRHRGAAFLGFLQGEEARRVLAARGFRTP